MSEQTLLRQRSKTFERVPQFLRATVRRKFLDGLSSIQWGRIEVIEDDHREWLGAATNPGPCVRVHVHEPDTFAYLGFGGSIGAGQSYFLGLWDTNNLTDLVRIMVHNRFVLDALDAGYSWPARLLYKWVHRRRDNTVANSRANISAHYDLGDDFYELMLDRTMMYSSAMFSRAGMSLEDAQIEKLDSICRKLHLQPDDHVLEIGSGWGGFAAYAAKHYGCRVTTTTISENQYRQATALMRERGVEHRVQVVKKDYRELSGKYDKLVSIEMIEAVGYRFFDTYFAQVGKLLKDDGLALIQAITIEDHRFKQYRLAVDFINRFIFPGGCLPSLTEMMNSLVRTTDLVAVGLEDLGQHYATTLRHWAENCERHAATLRSAGYSQSFLRMWQFYLSYCEGGFMERSISDVHLLLAKPRWRPPANALATAGPGRS